MTFQAFSLPSHYILFSSQVQSSGTGDSDVPSEYDCRGLGRILVQEKAWLLPFCLAPGAHLLRECPPPGTAPASLCLGNSCCSAISPCCLSSLASGGWGRVGAGGSVQAGQVGLQHPQVQAPDSALFSHLNWLVVEQCLSWDSGNFPCPLSHSFLRSEPASPIHDLDPITWPYPSWAHSRSLIPRLPFQVSDTSFP